MNWELDGEETRHGGASPLTPRCQCACDDGAPVSARSAVLAFLRRGAATLLRLIDGPRSNPSVRGSSPLYMSSTCMVPGGLVVCAEGAGCPARNSATPVLRAFVEGCVAVGAAAPSAMLRMGLGEGLDGLGGPQRNSAADITLVPETATLTDKELVRGCQNGDPRSWGMLLRRYKPRIYAVARAMGRNEDWVEDAVVEVLVQIYRSIGNFRGDSSFRTWAFGVARNVCSMEMRRHRRPQLPDDPLDTTGYVLEDPLQWTVRSDVQTAALEAVLRLPDKHRTAVAMYYIGQCSYPELASVMGIPVGTAKTWVYQGMRTIRVMLADHLRDEGSTADEN